MSVRAKAKRSYKLRRLLKRGGYGPSTGTLMSDVEGPRLFRDIHK